MCTSVCWSWAGVEASGLGSKLLFFPIHLHTSDIFISWFLPHSNDSHTLLRTQNPHCPHRTPLSWWRSKLMELNSRCKDYSVSVEVQGELMFVMNSGSIKGWRYHYRMLGFVKNLSINNSEVSSLSSMPGRLQLNSFSLNPNCNPLFKVSYNGWT